MGHILVVDDKEGVRRIIERGLLQAGHKVDLAADGNEALARAVKTSYDLVVMDMVMPGLGGLDTIVELRKLEPNIKVIAISGGDVLEPDLYLRAAQDLGVVATLPKPFLIDELVSEVDKAIGNQGYL
ncbi:response regulator [Verrucomicrobiota bacterium]